MGYYTNFKLEVLDEYGIDYAEYKTEQDVEKALESISGYDVSLGSYTEGIKWYDHEEDLVDISKRFPKNVFRLQGYGEGDGYGDVDIWVKFFRNGEYYMERGTIQLDTVFHGLKLKC